MPCTDTASKGFSLILTKSLSLKKVVLLFTIYFFFTPQAETTAAHLSTQMLNMKGCIFIWSLMLHLVLVWCMVRLAVAQTHRNSTSTCCFAASSFQRCQAVKRSHWRGQNVCLVDVPTFCLVQKAKVPSDVSFVFETHWCIPPLLGLSYRSLLCQMHRAFSTLDDNSQWVAEYCDSLTTEVYTGSEFKAKGMQMSIEGVFLVVGTNAGWSVRETFQFSSHRFPQQNIFEAACEVLTTAATSHLWSWRVAKHGFSLWIMFKYSTVLSGTRSLELGFSVLICPWSMVSLRLLSMETHRNITRTSLTLILSFEAKRICPRTGSRRPSVAALLVLDQHLHWVRVAWQAKRLLLLVVPHFLILPLIDVTIWNYTGITGIAISTFNMGKLGMNCSILMLLTILKIVNDKKQRRHQFQIPTISKADWSWWPNRWTLLNVAMAEG